MKKFLAIICAATLLISGCGDSKTSEQSVPAPITKAEPEQSVEKPQMTAWEVLTLQNHPRLNDSVTAVRKFYKDVPTGMVEIVEGNKNAENAVLFFKKQYADQSVGKYEQKDLGEVDKIICNFTKTGVQMTFDEVKPIVLSYFPTELAEKFFVYNKGYRFYDNAGNEVYAWQYKSNGEGFYKGKFPFDGNLVVAVKVFNGYVTEFGMFLGKNENIPFMEGVDKYNVEPFDVEFYY